MIYHSKSEKNTHKIAAQLAEKVMKSPSTRLRASVITLEGELGAGKTTFAKGFAKALGIKEKTKSPTFTLMKKYEVSSSRKFQVPKSKCQTNSKFLIHIDCYRVRDHRDLAILGLKSIFNDPTNIVLIEWPERVSKILPKKFIRVHIDHINRNKRKISIKI